MQLDDIVTTSAAVAATSRRGEKTALLASLLREADPDEVVALVGFLTGDLRQGRIGVGWAALAAVDVAPATTPTLTVGDVDRAVTELAAMTGPGSQALRHQRLGELFAAATRDEAELLRRLFLGELQQGANHGVVTDAVAKAAGIPLAAVRRAAMLAGDLGAVADAARRGGADALSAIGLRVLHPVQPMLASTAGDVAEALGDIAAVASVEWKLDGVRIQVHRRGDEVRIYTRNLNDVTSRLDEVVEVVRGFDADAFVLDGEVIGAGAGEGEHEVFQDTMSRFGAESVDGARSLRPHFFDLLHLDGIDHLDQPLAERRGALEALAGGHVIPGVLTDDAEVGSAVLRDALAAGHEGVMVKDATSRYEAGRRGKAWRKVKPVHTLDLVVIGAEWGHGRRTGLLSNLHLGARDPAGGPAIMVGKTFKGLTDELLAWQTEALLARERSRSGITVFVEQDLVVEIALDGVQASTRYPGGVALRFARVRRYRDDKGPAEADTIDAVRALLSARPGA